ncbi:inositol 3-kinase-like [Quillaja saponaria]|uniref:Inositol 3-kinase n=1 Tax=Quillaja saponaria TaxID=32244 RepID=A0AAD7PM65_QUISA|nr:inositol 3-kinase-like [Quillaja saponaria]
MVRERRHPQSSTRRGLIVGNYCHDVLMRDGVVVAETLGGAASFISAVLDGLSIPYNLIAKVGKDFAYAINHSPIVIPTSMTTLFHAYFDSEIDTDGHQDRVLKRVCACDPIKASDLPETRFDFGMAVGVGGEILPEALERMVGICTVVFVDVQALIREFDVVDGTVKLVELKESGFFHLLPRIGVLKASADEALFIDVEVVRKWCCVVVTHGKDGCKVYWKDGEMQISPFAANQVDPTGAGDSFLGGFVAGLVHGLAVPDAALLGNFFGSLTVGQVGLPKLDLKLFQIVNDEMQKRKMQDTVCNERRDSELNFWKQPGHEQFHTSLSAAKVITPHHIQECEWNLTSSPRMIEQGMKTNLLINSVHEGPIQSADGKP